MAELVHNANVEIEKARETNQKRLEGLQKYKRDKNTYETYLQNIKQFYESLAVEEREKFELIGKIITEFKAYSHSQSISTSQSLQIVGELVINDQRVQSLLREKQEEIYRLKDLVVRSGIRIDGSQPSAEIFEKVKLL